MSWLSENYEKASLGGAVVVALACGAVVFSNKDAVDEAFAIPTVKRNTDVSVPGLEEIEDVRDSLDDTHVAEPPTTPSGRSVNLMTGVSLFARRNDLDNPVDLLQSGPVHPPIPNKWWLDNNLNPGYSDSTDRDPDEDGFSNMEEFVAKTDPNDFKSYPDPVVKLKALSVKSTQVQIKPSGFGDGKFKFKLQTLGERELNKMGQDPIAKGDNIVFRDELMKTRFKFKDVLDVEVDNHGIAQTVRIWVIEDLKPNKAGTLYRFDRRGHRTEEGEPKGVVDSTVELTLDALKQGGSPFTLEENVRFALPYDSKATGKPYLLKKVDRANKQVEVEYTDKDGNKKIHVMPYGK
ncbi:hypothetical protein HW115_11660 [Verrucomicrobiaceae bacterium N1E253]|uniref:Uncharacterized protein n=1 Tax=Oceaniferula marina TaxID=2748318 RepID=A0A851GGD9_9BACT|nr:Amuc_1099 family pilus-like system protein [Oceaniferula marina]NWK56269.1 hypothetical protein [Oceaniferula marina]